MSFGPELIWCWSKFLSGTAGAKVRKAEAADNWAALSFPGKDILLLSWDTQACGVAIAAPDEKKALVSVSRQTPTILGALKKHLVGAELTEVRQLRRDKLLEFTFRRAVSAEVSVTHYLLLEAMERYSNLILTDETHTVIEAAKHIHPSENRLRSILPSFPYTPPPEFKGISLEEWLGSPSSETITKIAGFGAVFLRAMATADTGNTAEILSQFYKGAGQNHTELFQPQMIGRYITFAPQLPAEVCANRLGSGLVATGKGTTLKPLLDKPLAARRKNIENYINREILRRERQSEDIRKLLAVSPEELRKDAGLIISNLHLIESGAPSCELSGWGDNGAPVTAVVKLNPAFSPQKNAAMLFDKYKKTVAAQKRAAKLLEKVQQETGQLREQLPMASLAEDESSLASIEKELGMTKVKTKQVPKARRESSPLPPHKRFDLGYALVFAGLSAGGNRYITFNLASPEDLWFHAQGVPGSHVILRFYGAPSDEQSACALRFCASLAVWFSKARESGKSRVDFTRKKHVFPIKGSIAGTTYKEFESAAEDGSFWAGYLASLEN